MSREDMAAMRSALDAFNRRDGPAFDALLAEDAEIVPVRAAVEGTTYRGSDAGTQYCAAVDESWEELRWEVEEIRDGDGWVLALGHIRGHSRGSGAALDVSAGWVGRFSAGRIRAFQTFPERAGALAAVGLSRSG